MCKSSDCQHKKETPLKDWKHRCKFGPDGKRIQSGKVIAGWNDMATTHPDLAKECMDDPTKYQAGTHKVLRWKCRVCPHEWPSSGNHRLYCAYKGSGNTGCGVCSNRVLLKGWNDMATTHPELAKECLDDPTEYIAGTNVYLRWRCSKCKKEWKATGDNRTTSGHGCWDCGQIQSAKTRTVSTYEESLAFHRPDLVIEYRGSQDPKTVFLHSGQTFDWQCGKCGRIYPATVNNRTACGSGCKKCWLKSSGRMHREKKIISEYKDSFAFHRPEMVKWYRGKQDPKTVYLKSNQRFFWICLSCKKEHETTVFTKMNGSGFCNNCKKCGHNKSKPSFFYLLCRPGMLKFGIMNVSTNRLKTHKKNGWEILDKVEMAGSSARAMENEIKRRLREIGIFTGPRVFQKKFDGWLETFQEADLYVRSIRGLCRKLAVSLEAYLAA